MHTRFCKSVLGVNASCSNFAIWGELGRIAIKLSIFKHLLVYYHCSLVSEEDNLLTKALRKVIISNLKESLDGYPLLRLSLGIQNDKAKITCMKLDL